MLEINNLSKTYKGGKKAVDNLSLSINSGDIYGFIGHNGAGKTTTIKCCVGILDFEGGNITIDGHNVKDEPLLCKSMLAYIPDNPDLYENLTAIQYLNFIADIFSVNKKTRTEKIEEYTKLFGIYNELGNQISSFSHGMKQKLAIISALIHNPKLLILDEPFVGLDPEAAFNLKKLMHDMCDNGGAIFFSTHVLEVAQKLCNKIAIIDNGRLVRAGLTEELTEDKSLEDLFMEVVNHDKSN